MTTRPRAIDLLNRAGRSLDHSALSKVLDRVVRKRIEFTYHIKVPY